MNTHVDATIMRIVSPHLDPDYQHERSMQEEARERAIEAFIDDWCAGDLPDYGGEDVNHAPLQALIDNEPGLLQQLVGDFRSGDAAELEQSTGILARAIIKYAIEQVERVMR